MPVLAFLKSVPSKYYLWLGIALLLIYIGGVMRMSCHHCPKLIGTSVTVKYDTVQTHDTIYAKMPITITPKITFHKIVEPEIKPIIIPDVPTIKADTSYCYESNWKESDGACIGIKVCSVILPQSKPPDFSLEKSYVAAPRIEKTITIRDTFALAPKLWNISLGAGAGYGINDRGQHGFTANAGIYIGYAIKQF